MHDCEVYDIKLWNDWIWNKLDHNMKDEHLCSKIIRQELNKFLLHMKKANAFVFKQCSNLHHLMYIIKPCAKFCEWTLMFHSCQNTSFALDQIHNCSLSTYSFSKQSIKNININIYIYINCIKTTNKKPHLILTMTTTLICEKCRCGS